MDNLKEELNESYPNIILGFDHKYKHDSFETLPISVYNICCFGAPSEKQAYDIAIQKIDILIEYLTELKSRPVIREYDRKKIHDEIETIKAMGQYTQIESEWVDD